MKLLFKLIADSKELDTRNEVFTAVLCWCRGDRLGVTCHAVQVMTILRIIIERLREKV